jgi:hypothetical protein
MITTATAAVAAEGGGSAGDGAAKWNEAWAIYGYLGNAAAHNSLYGTANKRCKNYDTCDATMKQHRKCVLPHRGEPGGRPVVQVDVPIAADLPHACMDGWVGFESMGGL